MEIPSSMSARERPTLATTAPADGRQGGGGPGLGPGVEFAGTEKGEGSQNGKGYVAQLEGSQWKEGRFQRTSGSGRAHWRRSETATQTGL